MELGLKLGIISRRMPYQTNSDLRNNMNKGLTEYIDMNLSVMPQFVNYGFLPKVNVAIIEALAITEEWKHNTYNSSWKFSYLCGKCRYNYN